MPQKRQENLNKMLWYTFTSMKGEVVVVTTKSGVRHIGVLSHISENDHDRTLDIVLEYAQRHNARLDGVMDLNKFCNGTSYIPELKIPSREFAHLYAPRIPFDHDKQVDPENIGKERELKPFQCDPMDTNKGSSSSSSISGSGSNNNKNSNNNNNNSNNNNNNNNESILDWAGDDDAIDEELKQESFDQFKDKDTTYHEGLYNQTINFEQVSASMAKTAKALADRISAQTTNNPHVLEDRNVEQNISGYMNEEDMFSAVKTNMGSKPTKAPTKPPIKAKTPSGNSNPSSSIMDTSFIDADITRKHLLELSHSAHPFDINAKNMETTLQSHMDNGTMNVDQNILQRDDIIDNDDSKPSKLNPDASEFNPDMFSFGDPNMDQQQKSLVQDTGIDPNNYGTTINSNTNMGGFANTNPNHPLAMNSSAQFYPLLSLSNMTTPFTNNTNNQNINNNINNNNVTNPVTSQMNALAAPFTPMNNQWNNLNNFTSLSNLNSVNNNYQLNNFNHLNNANNLNTSNFNLPTGVVNTPNTINMGLGMGMSQIPMNMNFNDMHLNNLSGMNFVNSGVPNTNMGNNNEYMNTMNVNEMGGSTMVGGGGGGSGGEGGMFGMNVATQGGLLNMNNLSNTNAYGFTSQQIQKDNGQGAFKPFASSSSSSTPMGGAVSFVTGQSGQMPTMQPQQNLHPFFFNYQYNPQ